MRSSCLKGLSLFLLAFALSTSACSNGGPGGQGQDGFESDLPESSSGGGARGEGATGADSSAPGVPSSDDASESDGASPERAILEADIIQLAGDTLYAMSRNGGLSLVDVSNPESLKLLGRYRELSGEPFEMYVQDGVVFAMFSSWGEYVADGDAYTYVQTSKLVALDVGDPAAIKVLGKFDVPGRISDSRIVGKVLYVVGHEDGYCWRCEKDKPHTTVISLNVSDPRAPTKVDELSFSDAQGSYSWSRSVTVTDKRMYVAGPEYGQNGPTGSSIQVIDISDPAGDLVEGAVVKVAGQVSSRWQIDEYQDVLRVISQPAFWSVQGRTSPSVQTFRVQSASQLTALGSTQLVLPDSRETLRSVRFDGTRAYAITALQQDPLFTIDLSDPARPRQVGELHMPGFVYHMEPRGDRVIGLGFDQGNREGAITVSIFDVSNLAAPKQLSRVNFGGDWGSLPEDQDRIHKAFRILPELNLVLVPFSGWSDWRRDDQKRCASRYQSGVQLVDLNGDTLKLRGTAPSMGEARRALVHREHLFTISDARVETFDIRDRNTPRQNGGVALSRFVQQAIPLANGIVARVNANYWSESPWIDLVGNADVAAPERSLGELSLGEALRGDSECEPYSYVEAAFGQGSQVEILYRRYEYTADYREADEVAGVLVIDVEDPAAPTLRSKLEWSMRPAAGSGPDVSSYQWYSGYGDYTVSYNPTAISIARAGDALIALESSTRWKSDKPETKVRLRSVDLSDPSAPSTHVIELQDRHYTGLSVSGDDILLGYFSQGSKAGRVRFFVQHVDLDDPAKLEVGSSISVPGLLMYHDADTQRLITSQLARIDGGSVTAQECDQRFGFYEMKYANDAWSSGNTTPDGACTGYQQTLQLVKFDGSSATLEDSLTIEEEHVISSSSLGRDRVFAVLSQRYSSGGWIDDCFGPCGGRATKSEPVELLVLSGFERGRFSAGRVSVDSSSDPWWGFWGSPQVYANGTKAILTGNGDLSLVDAADSAAPTLMRTEALFGGVHSVSFQDDTAFLALGQAGAQRLELR
jgi:hypothetical protein